ncbi:MAG: cellulose synthase complex periplasmic endoglucanase BcsZ [Methylococcaceae bacterium]|nr:cellulose synthase complex periplasmic endoglucanase BcsZ [Methylococcaceae bacterium]
MLVYRLNPRSGRLLGLATLVVAGLIGLALSLAVDRNCPAWPEWNRFKTAFLSEGGRVIDPSSPLRATVSEGQAYALFFALVADDRPAFDAILRWTEDNLAQGDLTAHLPAWHWGRRDESHWGVLDDNSATDADLWLAYALGEAGRLWREERWVSLSSLLAHRILRTEIAELPGLGPVLLPGPSGFHPDAQSWRLNPSYMPMPLLRRFAALYPQSAWPKVADASLSLLLETAPQGYAPDWVLYRSGQGFSVDSQTQGEGGYNAIRVYLWAGLMSAQDPARGQLLQGLSGMARHVVEHGVPPESVDTQTGLARGTGPVGFSAALVPFLDDLGETQSVDEQLQRLQARPLRDRPAAYYDHALVLFGLGWREGRFRFAVDGALIPAWKRSCLDKGR